MGVLLDMVDNIASLYDQIDFLRERLREADRELGNLKTQLSNLLGDKGDKLVQDQRRNQTSPDTLQPNA